MALNDQDYAIVIGINSYPQLRPLGAAVADAIAFAEWLVLPEGGGLLPQHVALITSPAKQDSEPFNAKPIQRDIDLALRDFGVELNQKIGRRLYFYFSGHGFGPSFDDVGMLMADASNNRLKSNIGLRPYKIFFHDLALFEELVFIVDCCRDPFLSEETMGPLFTLEPKLPLPQVEEFAVLAAAYGAKAFEKSATSTEERRGILTKALLEGLRERAAVDQEGRVTAFTLSQYVLSRVKDLATAEQKDQTPEIRAPMGNVMLFGEVSPANTPTLRVHIVAPAGFVGDLILRHGSDLHEMGRHTVTNAGEVWERELPRNSLYVVDRSDNGTPGLLDPRNIKDEPYVFRLQ